ncbi:MBL fold metallo-hydrolase [Amycolatopsis acidicola]|uniref:MBL fold metallo-hydrolase n=1 Tax=Amycolatopsis acidicola TaxID=2596893 RepID=A0A5N0V0Q3_9PSEU|nr:MBL fold metallo-hydrolase [Amycolatopsis acidicola]KAA9159313.1 MBL fold metallo-hydrolase [Amycolatopsis acidicola]
MQLEHLGGGVHLVTGTNVNWALVTEGDAVTVVDAGYPNDGRALLESLAAIGRRPGDVQAVVLTHAHLDHLGGIPALLREHRVPVLTGEAEVAHAHRERLEQISPAQMLRQCGQWRGLVWTMQTVRAVLPHASMSVPEATSAANGVPLDLPGALTPLATPGHTTGHTVYYMASAGIVFSGDALVTAHPLLPGPPRPQLLPRVFNENEAEMRRSLSVLGELEADILVPGHGPVERRALAEIVADVGLQ